MLIDGGGVRDGSFDPGARIVEPFLRARGIGRVDVVALSHPHPDHLNGLFRILERFEVGAFWTSGDDGHNPEYRRLVALGAAARRRRRPRSRPTRLGGARSSIPLGPVRERRRRRGERIARAPRADRERRVAGAARRVRGARASCSRAISRPTARGSWPGAATSGRSSPRTCSRSRTTAAGPRPARSWSTRSRPTLAVISLGWRNQFHFPAPEVRGALRGPRRARAAHRSGRRDHRRDHRPEGRLDRALRARLSRRFDATGRRRPADEPACACRRRVDVVATSPASGAGAPGCATAPRPLQPRALALQAAGVEALGRGELDRAAGHFALALEYEPRLGRGRERPRPGRRATRRLDARRGALPRRARAQRRSRGGPPQPGGRAVAPRRGGRRARRGARRARHRSGLRRRAPARRPSCCSASDSSTTRAGSSRSCARPPPSGRTRTPPTRWCWRASGARAAAEQEARARWPSTPTLPAAHRARAEILRRAGDLEGASRRAGRRHRVRARRRSTIASRTPPSPPRAGCGPRPRASWRRCSRRRPAGPRCTSPSPSSRSRADEREAALRAAEAALALRAALPGGAARARRGAVAPRPRRRDAARAGAFPRRGAAGAWPPSAPAPNERCARDRPVLEIQ